VTRYRTIVADPPWAYDEGWPVNRGQNAGTRIGLPYGAMTMDEIHNLPVGSLAAPDAHLLLWTTNRYVFDAAAVARSWGFRHSQLLTWCKPPVGIGPGGVFANTSEFVVYARRGKPEHLQRVPSTWWEWPRGAHSQKPDAFLDLVEATLPGPYLELFARRARFGWDYWGNESLGTAQLEPHIP
jgi:N6-adenosine-specific RNA methylase IME4